MLKIDQVDLGSFNRCRIIVLGAFKQSGLLTKLGEILGRKTAERHQWSAVESSCPLAGILGPQILTDKGSSLYWKAGCCKGTCQTCQAGIHFLKHSLFSVPVLDIKTQQWTILTNP